MSGAVTLPARMDTSAAIALEARLDGDDDLTLDAGEVDVLGGLCLEVLLDAIARRDAAGATVTVTGETDAFTASLSSFGLDTEGLISRGGSR